MKKKRFITSFITRAKAQEEIDHSNGRIFGVRFIKKDGSVRRMSARRGVRKGVSGKGLAFDPSSRGLRTVFDMNICKHRMINLNTLEEITIDGIKYTVL